MTYLSPQTRLPEAVQSHGQTPVPPRRRLPSGRHGLWGRLSGLALWHGHGHHLHLLSQLDYWLLHILLSLLPLFSFFLTVLAAMTERHRKRRGWKEIYGEKTEMKALMRRQWVDPSRWDGVVKGEQQRASLFCPINKWLKWGNVGCRGMFGNPVFSVLCLHMKLL